MIETNFQPVLYQRYIESKNVEISLLQFEMYYVFRIDYWQVWLFDYPSRLFLLYTEPKLNEIMSFNQSFNDFWTCNPQSAQSRGMDQQHKSTSSQFLVSILLVKLIIISVLLWLLWIDATWMPMQFSWPEWFFKTIPVRYWSVVTSLGLLDLIIERTCLQTVYAQENYALDSQRRFHQI